MANELLDALLQRPPQVGPVPPEVQDALARQEQSTWSPARQKLIGGLEDAGEFLKGLLAGDPTDPTSSRWDRAGQVLGAGMPFVKLGKLVGLKELAGKPSVFHGTKGRFDLFDLAKNDPEDTLGWMTHAAETPLGTQSYWDDIKVGWQNQEHANSFLGNKYPQRGANVRPITASSQNAIDIATRAPEGPDWEPIKEYLTKIVEGTYKGDKRPHFTLPKQWAQDALDDYPRVMKEIGTGGTLDQQVKAWDELINGPHGADVEKALGKYEEGFRTQVITQNPLVETWLKRIRRPMNDPETFAKTGFDAVRYLDGTAPSWAFPKPEQLTTPWGTPLGSPESTMETLIRHLKKR